MHPTERPCQLCADLAYMLLDLTPLGGLSPHDKRKEEAICRARDMVEKSKSLASRVAGANLLGVPLPLRLALSSGFLSLADSLHLGAASSAHRKVAISCLQSLTITLHGDAKHCHYDSLAPMGLWLFSNRDLLLQLSTLRVRTATRSEILFMYGGRSTFVGGLAVAAVALSHCPLSRVEIPPMHPSLMGRMDVGSEHHLLHGSTNFPASDILSESHWTTCGLAFPAPPSSLRLLSTLRELVYCKRTSLQELTSPSSDVRSQGGPMERAARSRDIVAATKGQEAFLHEPYLEPDRASRLKSTVLVWNLALPSPFLPALLLLHRHRTSLRELTTVVCVVSRPCRVLSNPSENMHSTQVGQVCIYDLLRRTRPEHDPPFVMCTEFGHEQEGAYSKPSSPFFPDPDRPETFPPLMCSQLRSMTVTWHANMTDDGIHVAEALQGTLHATTQAVHQHASHLERLSLSIPMHAALVPDGALLQAISTCSGLKSLSLRLECPWNSDTVARAQESAKRRRGGPAGDAGRPAQPLEVQAMMGLDQARELTSAFSTQVEQLLCSLGPHIEELEISCDSLGVLAAVRTAAPTFVNIKSCVVELSGAWAEVFAEPRPATKSFFVDWWGDRSPAEGGGLDPAAPASTPLQVWSSQFQDALAGITATIPRTHLRTLSLPADPFVKAMRGAEFEDALCFAALSACKGAEAAAAGSLTHLEGTVTSVESVMALHGAVLRHAATLRSLHITFARQDKDHAADVSAALGEVAASAGLLSHVEFTCCESLSPKLQGSWTFDSCAPDGAPLCPPDEVLVQLDSFFSALALDKGASLSLHLSPSPREMAALAACLHRQGTDASVSRFEVDASSAVSPGIRASDAAAAELWQALSTAPCLQACQCLRLTGLPLGWLGQSTLVDLCQALSMLRELHLAPLIQVRRESVDEFKYRKSVGPAATERHFHFKKVWEYALTQPVLDGGWSCDAFELLEAHIACLDARDAAGNPVSGLARKWCGGLDWLLGLAAGFPRSDCSIRTTAYEMSRALRVIVTSRLGTATSTVLQLAADGAWPGMKSLSLTVVNLSAEDLLAWARLAAGTGCPRVATYMQYTSTAEFALLMSKYGAQADTHMPQWAPPVSDAAPLTHDMSLTEIEVQHGPAMARIAELYRAVAHRANWDFVNSSHVHGNRRRRPRMRPARLPTLRSLIRERSILLPGRGGLHPPCAARPIEFVYEHEMEEETDYFSEDEVVPDSEEDMWACADTQPGQAADPQLDQARGMLGFLRREFEQADSE